MDQLIQYFLAPYTLEKSFLLRRKMKIFILTCLYGATIGLLIFVMHAIAGSSFFLLIADALELVFLALTLYMIRIRRVDGATNLFWISFILFLSVSNLLNDYLSLEPKHYLRLLETTLSLLIILVMLGLFSLRVYPVKATVGAGIVLLAAHYWILIEKHAGGHYSTESLLVVVVYSMLLIFMGMMTIFTFTTNDSLVQLQEQESEKVKRLNQSLESKVAERTQQLEQQNKELLKVNNELDQFVYRVSHDLRAPLASVLGLITIARQEDQMEKVREYLALQEKSVHKLDHFIQDIIHLSKNSRADISRERIDFQELIKDVFHEHSFSEQALRIEKIAEVTQTSPFFSDQERLRIVLGNLISNAIRYGNLFQEKPFVKVQVHSDDTLTRIEVSDNGQGIPAEHLDKIFNMFYRASSQKVGTGLGLYIVKETVEKLHGKILVTSEVGVGSQFVIELNGKARERQS